MVSFKVISPGFREARLQPVGTIITMESKPKKTPSWMEEIKPESSAARKKREAAEAKALKENRAKAEADKKEASFMGGEDTAGIVETI